MIRSKGCCYRSKGLNHRANAGSAGLEGPQDGEGGLGFACGQDHHHPPLVGKGNRVKTEQVAGPLHRWGHRDCPILQLDPVAGAAGNFIDRTGQSPPGEIPEAVELQASCQQGLHGPKQGG